jgi:hypothetical protein
MTSWETEASQRAANGNTEQQTQINTEQNQEKQKSRAEYKRDGSSVSGPKPIELKCTAVLCLTQPPETQGLFGSQPYIATPHIVAAS